MRPGGLVAITVATLLTMATIFSLAAYQVTTEGAATRLLSRLAASMFPGWLADHWGVPRASQLPVAALRRAARRVTANGDALSTRRAP